MKDYERAQMIVTDLSAEDVIVTSEPDMYSPNYQSGESYYGFNWTLWQ